MEERKAEKETRRREESRLAQEEERRRMEGLKAQEEAQNPPDINSRNAFTGEQTRMWYSLETTGLSVVEDAEPLTIPNKVKFTEVDNMISISKVKTVHDKFSITKTLEEDDGMLEPIAIVAEENECAEWNEVKQVMFRKNLNRLQAEVSRNSSAPGEVRIFFQTFNKVFAKCDLDIQYFNSLITILSSGKAARDAFHECSISKLSPHEIYNQLKEVWIHEKLEKRHIQHSESDLRQMIPCLSYSLEVVSLTISKLKSGTKIENVIDFFLKLQNCEASQTFKEHFLLCGFKKDSSNMLLMLANALIEVCFSVKFPGCISKDFSHGEYLVPAYKPSVTQIETDDRKFLPRLQHVLAVFMCELWNFDCVKQLIDCLDSSEKVLHLIGALDHFNDYGLCNLNETMLQIVQTNHSENWSSAVHRELIKQSFEDGQCKNSDLLMQEIILLNNDKSQLDTDELRRRLSEINRAYNGESQSFNNCGPIKNWNDVNIREWSSLIRAHGTRGDMYEMVAIANRAMEIHSKFTPRETQNLALLLLLDEKRREEGGRLLQINTGEGKTCIVAMFAAISALHGHSVDVITSSPELAKPQCEQYRAFFELFNLTASHNVQDGLEINGVYTADIVYGAAGNFQGDILRDEYSNLGVRKGRNCDVAVVDEVDSMLIDGRNHIAMLSSPTPGMDNLEAILAIIWIQIGQTENCVVEKDGTTYCIDFSCSLNEDGSSKTPEDILDTAVAIELTKSEFIKNSTEIHIRKLLRDREWLNKESVEIEEEFPEMHIPKHSRNLVLKCQLTNWIDSAMYAKYRCVEEKHYILKDGEILPVDSANTGVIQENMRMHNGVHQFLQIKHGAKITPESFTTNFLSNVTFFLRYNKNIFGLTGTLGSKKSEELLKETYRVDTVTIPTFKQKQFKQLKTILVSEVSEWLAQVAQSCIQKLKEGRAVLVIMQYMTDVEDLKKHFLKVKYNGHLSVYKSSNDSHVINRELEGGDIIIATNIAGRGTDINVAKEVENVGGLHVCVTFMPVNERVEEQNFGRTSRTGNRGTGQFVLISETNCNFDELKDARDNKEEKALCRAKKEVRNVTRKDAIFKTFCRLLTTLRDKLKEKRKLDGEVDILLRAVEEGFAIWVTENGEFTYEDEKQTKDKFRMFCENVLRDCEENTLIKNPYFHILHGNELLRAGNYEAAIVEYTRAILLDDYFLSGAYYNRGYCKVALYAKRRENTKIVDEAVEDFKMAKHVIQERLEPMLHVLQQASSSSEALSEQVKHKLNLYGIQKNAIETAIGRRDGMVDDEIKRLNHKNEGKTLIDTEQYVKHLQEKKVRIEGGVIGEAMANGNDIEISLKSLNNSLPDEIDAKLCKAEMDDFECNGNLGSFEIREIKPIPWGSCLSLALIGISQIVAGAAIGIFTVGVAASVGFGMLAEGISDIFTCIKDGIINRNFNWSDWGIQKAVSYTVCLVCAGVSVIKDVAKTLCHGVKQTGRLITNTVTQSVKTGWKLAAKKIGIELSKGVAKELTTALVEYGIEKILKQHIEMAIMKFIRKPIQEAMLTNPTVKRLIEQDNTNRNKCFQAVIIQEGLNIIQGLNQEGTVVKKMLVDISIEIASEKIQSFSEFHQVFNAISAVKELHEFVPKFIESLNAAIEKIGTCNETQRKANTGTCDFNKENVKDTKEGLQVQLKPQDYTSDVFVKSLCESVTSAMFDVIQKKLISPVVSRCINYGITEYTKDVDESLEASIKNYKSDRRIKFFQDEDKNQRIGEELKKGFENPDAVQKAREVIENVENGGEIGLLHLDAIKDVINRPIAVFDARGNVSMIIGEHLPGDPISVQYHESTLSGKGYWTLIHNKEPLKSSERKSDCLFNVIAEQTGNDPALLRQATAEVLKRPENFEILANEVCDFSIPGRNSLFYGGTKYDLGAAEDVINGWNGQVVHGEYIEAHPLGHVS